jgi:hypothetical protein
MQNKILRTVVIHKGVSPELQNTLIKHQYMVSLVSLVLGFILIVPGVAITTLGATGNIQWLFKAGGFESNLTNASPGIVLCVVGFLIIFCNRYSVTI